MERPERPTRHKSHPMKYTRRDPAIFSSDSESDMNDNVVVIPYHISCCQSSSEHSGGGPSTSAAAQPTTQTQEAGTSSGRASTPLMPVSPQAQVTNRFDLTQEPKRRKRPFNTTTASTSSDAFDNLDSQIVDLLSQHISSPNRGNDTSERRGESMSRTEGSSETDRFSHNDFLIRPRSFCSLTSANAMNRPPDHKMKRPNAQLGPIDLTPSTSNRGSTSPSSSSYYPSDFTLFRDSLQSNLDSTRNNYFNSRCIIRSSGMNSFDSSLRSDHQSTSSSILRHFDEMCPPNSSTRRSLRPSVRFRRFFTAPQNHEPSSSPSSHLPNILRAGPSESREQLPSLPQRNSSLDDYCDLVGNFLFGNCSFNNSDNQSTSAANRSSTPNERAAQMRAEEPAVEPTLVPTSPDIQTLHPDIQQFSNYISNNRSNRSANDIGAGTSTDQLEQSNDDVIVVETPERPPPPESSDSYVVPSSRSPSPLPRPSAPLAAEPPTNKSGRSTEVPMTLQDLNQSLVSLLECPVCLDHATPPIYQCGKGHILCQGCHPRLTTCPICRSRLPGDRNSAMEKVAEKLMYPCKNTVTGCSVMLKLEDKQAHEESCGFRHYACIVPACYWKGYKPELVVHLQSNHPDKLISGASKEVHVPIPPSVQVGHNMFVAHNWIQSAHNEVFNIMIHIDLYKRAIKGCVIYIGSPDKADKFTFVFEMKQHRRPFNKLTYSRRTHADTLKTGQPPCLSNHFSVSLDTALQYQTGPTIPITVTVRPEL